MDRQILKRAIKKFNKFKTRYAGFINVAVDNWRGYRFIFDTTDTRRCNNRCYECSLYKLLKNEKERPFSFGLYPANDRDKRLFGSQNYLNCKSLKQYQQCYINFLVKRAKTKEQIVDEIALIKNFQIIYSSQKTDIDKLEKRFKQEIINRVLKNVSTRRGKLIKNLWYT